MKYIPIFLRVCIFVYICPSYTIRAQYAYIYIIYIYYMLSHTIMNYKCSIAPVPVLQPPDIFRQEANPETETKNRLHIGISKGFLISTST